MGEKQVSVRTLDTGEKVYHHPDGTQVLVPTNTLAEVVGEQAELQEKASAELQEATLARVEEKREHQQEGRAVPSDKSPL